MSANILIIDDDMEVNRLVKAVLENAGYQTTSGFDGQMALNLAKKLRPQLMIMDVNMPMTNGLKALEYLRQSSDTRNIPIIFLTGATSSSVYPVLAKYQRVAFLKKPVDIDQLLEMVRQFLQLYPLAA